MPLMRARHLDRSGEISISINLNNMTQIKPSLGIYIHIPFCKSRCIYCDFVSSVDDCSQRDKYVEYLCRQIRLASEDFSDKYTVDTIYFGGGTPTLLDDKQFDLISKEIFKRFHCALKEFSVEANPCTIDREKLIALKNIGVTRLSIGVQSFNDGLLKMLGRRHDAKRAEDAIRLAVELGFDVSVDAMIGLPNQTKADVKDFIDRADMLGVEHISVYMLSVEDGTRLKSLIDQGKLIAKSDDQLADLYEYACLCLKEHNFQRYEISNFCKNQKLSHHNLRYWQRLDYLGLGMGAHSLTSDERWNNSDNFKEYYDGIDKGDYRRNIQKLSKEDVESEYIMLAFRLQKVIQLSEFNMNLGENFFMKYSKAIEKNLEFLEVTSTSVAIKDKYLQLMNSIIVDFI
ncbi:MAG: radical SAM family heme chaperone HemW [Clostridia bacterium]|nr:radical SAM family heme chaperone HemW [Clostridia bacterium]